MGARPLHVLPILATRHVVHDVAFARILPKPPPPRAGHTPAPPRFGWPAGTLWRMVEVPSAKDGTCGLAPVLHLDGFIMMRLSIRRCWPGLLALAWLLHTPGAHAWGNNGPIPISTDSVFIYRFDVKIGAAAFARPAGPWYSYFPVDPNLLAQRQATAFPNWPTQFPPAVPSPAPVQPIPTQPAPPPGLTYYQPPPYSYGPAVYPAGYYAPQPAPGYWYAR